MILTGSGQNIYPEEIEDKLNNMYMVQESLVLEHNGRLTALVVPDFEQAELEGIDKEELPRIMENNLKELNKLLASYEQVASITVYPTEFEKTPKRKDQALPVQHGPAGKIGRRLRARTAVPHKFDATFRPKRLRPDSGRNRFFVHRLRFRYFAPTKYK